MPKIIKLPAGKLFLSPAIETDIDYAVYGHASSYKRLPPGAKEEIRKAVLVLDIAVQYARRLPNIMQDQKIASELNDQLAIIEELLEMTRINMQKF